MASVATTRYADLGPDLVVQWNGDGTYTPRCDLCSYTGKPRVDHSRAAQAIRKHSESAGHKDLLSSKEMSS